MTFKYDFSDSLIETLKLIYKKDKKLYTSIFKKVEEIVSRDLITIDFYKNLRYDLKEYKRVHVMKSFVLLFKVYKTKNLILFERLDHHDNIYKK
jgi:mRNA-degrading endonuclease RelE of RelBE toxin-antitoxin system